MPRPLSGLYKKETASSGTWIDAAFHSCKDCTDFEFHLLSFDKRIDQIQTYSAYRHQGYVVPHNDIKKHLLNLKSHIKPDIVQLWGTEHDYMLAVVELFYDIPKIAYIQGVARNIAKNYMAGISWWDSIKHISLKDICRHAWISARKKDMLRLADIEEKVLQACQGVILENDWCEDQIKVITPNIKVYRSKLPLKDVFFNYRWDASKMIPHTIFTNAGGYPIKGHHTLFEALHYVVQQYPDTILYIPGHSRLGSGFTNWSRRSSYENILSEMARRYGISNNIIYTGILNSDEMAKKLIECNVFALPSWVENHSSSLLEAMVVGTPCAASIAGGAMTTMIHQENGLCHNPQDAECLAWNIIRIFKYPRLASKLSEGARKQNSVRRINLLTDFSSIYFQTLNEI